MMLCVCTRCKVHKPATDFGIDRETKSGRSRWCLECGREHKRLRRQDPEHRMRAIEATRRWRLANPEKAKAWRDARREVDNARRRAASVARALADAPRPLRSELAARRVAAALGLRVRPAVMVEAVRVHQLADAEAEEA